MIVTKLFKSAALALAASSVALSAVPAEARGHGHAYGHRYEQSNSYDNYSNGYGTNGYGYVEPTYQNSRVWQGQNGNYCCQKKDGTTGLVVGAAAGALLGRAVDRRGDRALGTVLGAAAGALLGKQVAQGTNCR
ncbi:MAG: glycine zipper 2TM domain-containing protein [Croceibacterium sp.]